MIDKFELKHYEKCKFFMDGLCSLKRNSGGNWSDDSCCCDSDCEMLEEKKKVKHQTCSWKFKCKKPVFIWVNSKKNILYSPLCRWHYFLANIIMIFRKDRIRERVKEKNRAKHIKEEWEKEKMLKERLTLRKLKEMDTFEMDYPNNYVDKEWEERRKKILNMKLP